MKKIVPLSMLIYLSCNQAEQKVQIPVVEIQHNSEINRNNSVEILELPPKYPQAKKDADFIVKMLEEKITENHAAYARGNIHITASQYNYYINYKFDPTEVCKVGSDNPLSKGALFINFQHWGFTINGNNANTLIYFETVRPFYVAQMLTYFHTKFTINGGNSK